MRPKVSSPSLVIKATEPPARAAAPAWFEPLPPGPTRKSPPSTVSPQAGRRGVLKARSATKMPITQIGLPAMVTSFLRAKIRVPADRAQGGSGCQSGGLYPSEAEPLDQPERRARRRLMEQRNIGQRENFARSGL